MSAYMAIFYEGYFSCIFTFNDDQVAAAFLRGAVWASDIGGSNVNGYLLPDEIATMMEDEICVDGENTKAMNAYHRITNAALTKRKRA